MRIKSFRKNFLGILLCGFLFSGAFLSNALAWDIAIFGDSQVHESIRRRVVHAILAFKPSVVFSAGDNVDNGNDPKQWKLFNDINEPLIKGAEYFAALGNHEEESSLCFINYPCLNHKRWYSVEREGIHFIVLDSNSDLRFGSDQYNWLVSDLNSIKAEVKFKIAIFHHPIFDVGFHRPDAKRLKPVLLPLFQKYGICAVFSGHDHNYQRFEYKGIYFIVTGGGGASLYWRFWVSPYLQKFVKKYHFCLISPGTDFLRVRVIGIDLRAIDDFTIPSADPPRKEP
jgi:predicted MPP superfamily phosphohydrolase